MSNLFGGLGDCREPSAEVIASPQVGEEGAIGEQRARTMKPRRGGLALPVAILDPATLLAYQNEPFPHALLGEREIGDCARRSWRRVGRFYILACGGCGMS